MFHIIRWISEYSRYTFSADLIASITVAIMIIPQSMAYALLAGLPPEVGLYASILPMILYALFGSSRYLSVGPAALVSLMTASIVSNIVEPGGADYHNVALLVALISGCMLTLMSFARLGMLATLLSKPILTGFTSAAAIIIGLSQLKYILGLDISSALFSYEKLQYIFNHWQEINLVSLSIGVLSTLIILMSGKQLEKLLLKLNFTLTLANIISKLGPLLAVAFFTIIAWKFDLGRLQNVKLVGQIPSGLPGFSVPQIDLSQIKELLLPSFLIALIGSIESISVAQSLASKKRERLHPNKELLGVGAANIGASFTGAFPVAGGLSRSIVNYSAGAQTPLASIFTALIVILVVLFLTPLFYYLPLAVLSSIVLIALTKLVDIKGLITIFNYDKRDAFLMIATFFAVLIFGIEYGLLIGVLLSIFLFLWISSKPHIAIVGRVGDNAHFRNILRHSTKTNPNILAIRVDESLFFANTKYFENYLLTRVIEQPEVKHVVLICCAMNFIDSSALETLENLVEELSESGVKLHLAEVKGPVMDKLETTAFLKSLGRDSVFLSTHDAICEIENSLK